MKTLLFAGLLATTVGASAACPPPGWDRAGLLALPTDGFRIDDAARREQLALGLTDCLANPDPQLRDGIAFEGLSSWLRSQQLSRATQHELFLRLLPWLETTAADAEGFRQPFAALVLSELARADRISPFLGADERIALAEADARYLRSNRDYRGFDAREGWRHGVAHSADLAMQLALNPVIDKPRIDVLLDAIASQVAPAGEHFYVYGEPDRLARPVIVIAQRGIYSDAEWQAWFERIAAPAPLSDWNLAFASQAGLAKRHNTLAFLLFVYTTARESDNTSVQVLAVPALAALRKLP